MGVVFIELHKKKERNKELQRKKEKKERTRLPPMPRTQVYSPLNLVLLKLSTVLYRRASTALFWLITIAANAVGNLDK
jgi:hypothetical protein